MATVRDKLSVETIFDSHADFLDCLHFYQQQEKEVFTVMNSKTIKNSHLAGIVDEKLKYLTVTYGCKFGKKVHSTTATGERQSSTYKRECPALIKLELTADKKQLVIETAKLIHENHPESKVLYSTIPEVRRLSPSSKAKTLKLLEMDANKKLIQNKFAIEANKLVTLKDLTNLKAQLKKVDMNLETAVKLLREKYGCDVFVHHEENMFRGLYFSTSDMRAAMSAWGVIVFVDGTYQLLNNKLTTMILLVEDGNGRSEVVGVGLLATEDALTLKWFAETFKSQNSQACDKMKCMMTDKDMTARNVFKEVFPDTRMLLCLFHTLQTFSRNITTVKMKITAEQQEKCLEKLQELAYSTSDEDYERLYNEFVNMAPQTVQDYFNKNWNNIKTEWTVYNMAHYNLGNNTNNRLENVNGKIKQVVKKNSSLCDFIDRFFIWLQSHNQETDARTAKLILKRPVAVYASHECELEYRDCLTERAFEKVSNEIRSLRMVTFKKSNSVSQECLINVKSKQKPIRATPKTCECQFHNSFLLPCKHILAVRRFFNMALFDVELCHQRWTKNYAQQNHRAFRCTETLQERLTAPPVVSRAPRRTIQTVAQKRRLVNAVVSDLVNIASTSCGHRFQGKLALLKSVLAAWQEGSEISVTPINDMSDHVDDPRNLDLSMQHLSITDGNCESGRSDGQETPSNAAKLDAIAVPRPTRIKGRPRGFEATTNGSCRKK